MGAFSDLLPPEDAPKQTGGAFSDLLPQETPRKEGGTFSDLIPPEDTGSVFSDIGGAIMDIPLAAGASLAAALEGKDPYGEKDWKDELIAKQEARSRELAAKPGGDESFLGISRKDIRDLPRNIGFSGISMAAGLGAGLPSGALNPALGWAAGGAASGIAAYRMDANSFIRDIRNAMDDESKAANGRPITDEEWKAVEPKILDAAHEHGLFEAIPEAIGNVAGLKIITSKLNPLTKYLGKNVVSRIAGKLAGLYGTELATETVTQMGQHNVERDVGLNQGPERSWTSPGDYWDSLKEVAPQTFLLTTILGLGGMAGHKAYTALKPGRDPVADVINGSKEGQLDKIPNSELASVAQTAKELAEETPDNQELAEAVKMYQAETERRGSLPDTGDSIGTMLPSKEPEMETEQPEAAPEEGKLFKKKPVDHSPGKQYKGDITDAESEQRSMAAGPVLNAKQDVVRRENIIRRFAKAVGATVYQGRIRKGKRELGFYHPKTDETRIKNRNDLETTAHEIAHFLDYNEKTFRKAYHSAEFKEEVRSVSYDQSKLHEGFAEYIRHWMTDREYANKTAPKFTAWFEKTLETHPHGKALKEAQTEMHNWFEQGALNRFTSKIGQGKPGLRERLSDLRATWFDRKITQVFDAFHGFKLAEQDLRGKDVKELPAYMAVRLLAGNRMVIRSIFEHGTINWSPNGDLHFTGAGLMDVFSDVSENSEMLEDALKYFVARRAAELKGQLREKHFTKSEIQAGLALGEQNPKFKEAFKKWQSFNQRMLDFAQTSGLLNEKTRARLDEMGQDYVPMYRVVEMATGEKVPVGRHPFRKLTGGTGNVKDVLDNITTNVAMLTEASMKNMAKQQIYNLVGREKGGAKYAAKIPSEIKTTWVNKEQILKWLDKNGAELAVQPVEEGEEATDPADDLENIATFFTFGHPPKGKNIDVVLYKGKPVYFEIADPLFMEAVNAFGTKPMALGFRILGGFKTALTRLVTAAPDFMMVNGMRDTLSAFLMSKSNFKPFIDSIRGMKTRLTKDANYYEAMINGLGFSGFVHGDTDILRYKMERFYSKRGIDYATVLDTPGRLLEVWDEIASATEYAARLQEYKNLRAKGVSARQAAFAGREISTDFALHGSSEFLKMFTSTVPFLGARLQGMYRLFRAAAPETFRAGGENESATRLAIRATMGITIPTILLYLLNRDDERYKKLPDWVRDLHWVILVPGSKNVYLIPKPFELGAVFGTIPERLTELEATRNGTKFAKALAWIVGNQLELGVTPQAVKPVMDVMMNKTWTGSPIVPEDLKSVAAFAQYRPWTSETMIAMGKALDMSPLKLESLFKGYFGTIGLYTMQMADNLVAGAQGKTRPAAQLSDYPIFRRLMREDPMRYTQYQQEFYDLSREISEVVATFNKFKQEGRAEDIKDYMSTEEQNRLYGASKASEKMKTVASQINKQIRFIYDNKNLSSDEKRRQINAMLQQQEMLFREAVKGLRSAIPQ